KKKKAVKPADSAPYTIETDDDDNETGYTLFTFKARASGVSKKTGEAWKRKIPLFNAAGVPLTDVLIGGGTEGKISYSIRPYYTATLGAGVSLQLEGVQVLKLVEYGSKNADSLGF